MLICYKHYFFHHVANYIKVYIVINNQLILDVQHTVFHGMEQLYHLLKVIIFITPCFSIFLCQVALLCAGFHKHVKVQTINSLFPASNFWLLADNLCKQFGPDQTLQNVDLDPNSV